MLETQTLLQWLFIDELLQVVQGFLHTIAFPLCPSYFEKKKKKNQLSGLLESEHRALWSVMVCN